MTIAHAKAMRRDPTKAERVFWSCVRRRQLDGLYFRRQHAIGAYVADFYCASHHLIVEIDGGQHAVERARDNNRTAWLAAQGFTVVRYWNNDVLGNTEGVIADLRRRLGLD